MAYYSTCLNCGCRLDPGERCSCQEESEKTQKFFKGLLQADPKTGQLAFAGWEAWNDCKGAV